MVKGYKFPTYWTMISIYLRAYGQNLFPLQDGGKAWPHLKNLLPDRVWGMPLGRGYIMLISSSPSTVLSRLTFCERWAQQEKAHQLMLQFMTSEDDFANQFTFPHKCYSSFLKWLEFASWVQGCVLFIFVCLLSVLHLQNCFHPAGALQVFVEQWRSMW